MDDQDKLLPEIFSAWQREDKDRFRLLVSNAFYRGITKSKILNYIVDKKASQPINEDFDEWAYVFVASDGMNDCPPG